MKKGKIIDITDYFEEGDESKNPQYIPQITNAKSDIPETKEDVLELKKSCQEAGQLFNEIDGIPESVRNFLKAASSINGASIEMYNEEIKEWAEENNMTENLRLRFA